MLDDDLLRIISAWSHTQESPCIRSSNWAEDLDFFIGTTDERLSCLDRWHLFAISVIERIALCAGVTKKFLSHSIAHRVFFSLANLG